MNFGNRHGPSAPLFRKAKRSTTRTTLRGLDMLTRSDPPANSMDAQHDKSKPVVIEYGIWDDEYALPPETASRYFGDELKLHIRHVRDLPTKAERLSTFGKRMPYITVEDFNCVGLEGQIDTFNTPWEGISEEDLKILNNNRFLWFNRAQNATSDDQDRRGSWGEGKFTLEWASKLQAQITWSRRLSSEPKDVLMGQTTLRRHTITVPAKGYGETLPDGKTDGQRFASYGFFSTTEYVDPKTGHHEYAPFQLPESLRRVLTTSGNLGRPSGSGGPTNQEHRY